MGPYMMAYEYPWATTTATTLKRSRDATAQPKNLGPRWQRMLRCTSSGLVIKMGTTQVEMIHPGSDAAKLGCELQAGDTIVAVQPAGGAAIRATHTNVWALLDPRQTREVNGVAVHTVGDVIDVTATRGRSGPFVVRLSCCIPLPQLVNIAFCGRTGVGKSSLLNGLLGLRPGEPLSLAEGSRAAECTTRPSYFIMPPGQGWPLVFWDLPGAGTEGNPAETYFEDKKLQYFDVVVMVTDGRWQEGESALWASLMRCQGLGKCIVYNKADLSFQAMVDEPERRLQRPDDFEAAVNGFKDRTKTEIVAELNKSTAVQQHTRSRSTPEARFFCVSAKSMQWAPREGTDEARELAEEANTDYVDRALIFSKRSSKKFVYSRGSRWEEQKFMIFDELALRGYLATYASSNKVWSSLYGLNEPRLSRYKTRRVRRAASEDDGCVIL